MKRYVLAILFVLIIAPKNGSALVLSFEPTAVGQAVAEVSTLVSNVETSIGKAKTEAEKLVKMGSLKSGLSDLLEKGKALKAKKDALMAKYEEAKAEYDKRKAEFDKYKKQVKDKIEEGKQFVEDAKDKIEEGKEFVEDAKDKIEEGKEKLEEGIGDLKDKTDNILGKDGDNKETSSLDELQDIETETGPKGRKEFSEAKDAEDKEAKNSDVQDKNAMKEVSENFGEAVKVVAPEEGMGAKGAVKVVAPEEGNIGIVKDEISAVRFSGKTANKEAEPILKQDDIKTARKAFAMVANTEKDKTTGIEPDAKTTKANEKKDVAKKTAEKEAQNKVRQEKISEKEAAANVSIPQKITRKAFAADVKTTKVEPTVSKVVPAAEKISTNEKTIKKDSGGKTISSEQKQSLQKKSSAKTSFGYGFVGESYTFGFAKAEIKTNQTENNMLVLPSQMSMLCDLGYEESIKNGAFKKCIMEHKKQLSSQGEDGEVNEDFTLAKRDVAERNILNGKAEYYAAGFLEAMKIQNESVYFKKNKIDHISSTFNDDIDNEWQKNREAYYELNRQFAVMQSMQARRVVNKIFENYAEQMGIY